MNFPRTVLVVWTAAVCAPFLLLPRPFWLALVPLLLGAYVVWGRIPRHPIEPRHARAGDLDPVPLGPPPAELRRLAGPAAAEPDPVAYWARMAREAAPFRPTWLNTGLANPDNSGGAGAPSKPLPASPVCWCIHCDRETPDHPDACTHCGAYRCGQCGRCLNQALHDLDQGDEDATAEARTAEEQLRDAFAQIREQINE